MTRHTSQKRKPPQTNVRALTADGMLTDMDGQFVLLLYRLNIYLDHLTLDLFCLNFANYISAKLKREMESI